MSDNIQEITADELRKMDSKEGLVLQGCGGDLQEWLDGINDILTDAGILLNGSRFESASVFQHEGLTNLLFSFENVELNMGKLDPLGGGVAGGRPEAVQARSARVYVHRLAAAPRRIRRAPVGRLDLARYRCLG